MAKLERMSKPGRQLQHISFLLSLIAAINTPLISLGLEIQQRQTFYIHKPNYTAITTLFQASTYRYLLVQSVTQSRNISISYDSQIDYANHINGTSRGLIYMLKGHEKSVNTYLTSATESVRVQVTAIPYLNKDPIPGGCCITCNFDNDPNIYLKKEHLKVRLTFQRANVYYGPGSEPKPCDGGDFSTFNNLEYSLYAYQLKENDFTEDNLFDGMWKMANPRNIKRYGKLFAKIRGTKSTIFVLQTIPQQGIVYNILIKDLVEDTEAAYVPTFAYDCDINDINTCKSFGSIVTIIYACLGGAVGLLLCFLGHKFLKLELFIGGVISGFFITYILILRFAVLDYTAHMLLSTAVGFVVGAVVLVLYMETKQFNTLFLNNALVVGSLVACCILFSPLSDLKEFSSNTIYLVSFCVIAVIISIPLLFFPKLTSIIFSSLVGGYFVVFTCSVFIHANFKYLVIEFILRAGIPSFADAYLRIPFQQNEYILCGVWGFLLFAGAFSQYYVTRNEVFPPASKKGRRSSRSNCFDWLRRKHGRTTRMLDERTPLLVNDNTEHQTEDSREGSRRKNQRHSINVV